MVQDYVWHESILLTVSWSDGSVSHYWISIFEHHRELEH